MDTAPVFGVNFLDKGLQTVYCDDSRYYYDEGNERSLRRTYGCIFGAVSSSFSLSQVVLDILILSVFEFF
jgi:hypothetical protein